MPGISQSERLFFGDFELDTVRRALCRGGVDLRLPPKEYQVLECLARRAGGAVSREELLEAVWPDVAVGDASLARCVSALRKRLGTEDGIEVIQAVPKFGYRFGWPVSLVAQETTTNATDAKERKGHKGRGAGTAQRRWWFGMAAGVTVLLVVALALRGEMPWGRAADSWTDPQTRLTWQRADNGVGLARGKADVDYTQAMQTCAALRQDGRSDWRLPTIAELQTLYDPARSEAGSWGGYRAVYWHVYGGIQMSGGETASDLTWQGDQTPAGEEQSFDFSYGRRNFDPFGFRADHRALCVR